MSCVNFENGVVEALVGAVVCGGDAAAALPFGRVSISIEKGFRLNTEDLGIFWE